MFNLVLKALTKLNIKTIQNHIEGKKVYKFNDLVWNNENQKYEETKDFTSWETDLVIDIDNGKDKKKDEVKDYNFISGSDIHGDIVALNMVIDDYETLRKNNGEQRNFLIFQGDYCDRSEWSLAVLMKLAEIKFKYRDDVILLRGNHEAFFFKDYWHYYTYSNVLYNFWNSLALSLIIEAEEDRIFFCHAAPPYYEDIKQNIVKIQNAKKIEIAENSIFCKVKGPNEEYLDNACYIVWNDICDKNEKDINDLAHK